MQDTGEMLDPRKHVHSFVPVGGDKKKESGNEGWYPGPKV